MEQLLLARSTVLSDSIEIRSVIDHAFDVVLSKHRNRQQSFALLATYLDTGGQAHIKRFIAFLERLPSIIESAEYEEHASLLQLVLIMANHPDLFQQWNSMSSKLMPVINRLLINQNKKPHTLRFVASFLSILASMRTKSILTSHLTNLITTVKQLPWQCVASNTNPALIHQFVHLLALFHAIRPSTVWMDSFRAVVSETRCLALKAGLIVASDSTANETETLSTILQEKIRGLSGVKKALMIKDAFTVQVELLTRMLKCGCVTGVITFNASNFISLAQEVLGFYGDVDATDPAVYIEQENGLSRVDTALISSSLKIDLLKCMIAFLHLNLPGLIRYGSLLLQPLMTLLTRREVVLVPTLLDACLECLSVAAIVLPNTLVIMLTASGAMDLLLSWFDEHVNGITKARQFITPLDSNTADASVTLGKRRRYKDVDVEFANDAATVQCLHVIKMLVSHAGHLLNTSTLSAIQRGLAKCMHCLEKGVLIAGLHDKKFVRPFAHRLRHSAHLQLSVLSLTSAVISRTGGNKVTFLGSLQQVCQLLLHASTSMEVKQEARNVSLLLGHLLHPSTVPLPPQSSAILAQEYINSEKKFYEDQKESLSVMQEHRQHPTEEVPTAKRVRLGGGSQLVEAPANEAVPVAKESAKLPAPKAQAVSSSTNTATAVELKTTVKVKALPLKKTTSSTAKTTTAAASAAVEDEGIPDIDISSDVE